MSFVGRWWRALNIQYDIVDTWFITFFTLSLTLALSIPSLLYYTYAKGENAAQDSYYDFDYTSHWYYLSAPALHSLQLWRLPASQFTFPLSAELIFGTPLLLLLRKAEWQLADRQWKRALLLLSVMLISMGCDTLIVVARDGAIHIQSGPYWLIFFLVPIYTVHVAAEWTVKVCKVSISNKAIVYFLTLHLLVVLVPASLLASAIPVALSLLYLTARWCVSGGLSDVLHPSRPQGMRVGRRGESSGYRLGGASSARSPTGAAAAGGDHAPRPASQYEKLLANAQAGKAPGSTSDGGSEVEVETHGVGVGVNGGVRHSNEVEYHSRHTQSRQGESLVSTQRPRPASTASKQHHTCPA